MTSFSTICCLSNLHGLRGKHSFVFKARHYRPSLRCFCFSSIPTHTPDQASKLSVREELHCVPEWLFPNSFPLSHPAKHRARLLQCPSSKRACHSSFCCGAFCLRVFSSKIPTQRMENFRHAFSWSLSEIKTEEMNGAWCTISESLIPSVTSC